MGNGTPQQHFPLAVYSGFTGREAGVGGGGGRRGKGENEDRWGWAEGRGIEAGSGF